MISQFFYLPATQKATEEERIKFTQERLAETKEWLAHDFVRTQQGSYSIANMNGEIVGWKLLITRRNWVYINRNWWNWAVEWFCTEHKCKLAETDLLYLVMQLYRERGFDVKPLDGSLCVTLFVPLNCDQRA